MCDGAAKVFTICMCVRVHNYGFGIDMCSFMCKLVQVINLF